MSAARRGRADWVWALVGLGFGALGLVFALVLRERSVTTAQASAPTAVADDTVLLQLVEEVRLLREAIERRPAPLATPSRLPVSGATDEASADSTELRDAWFAELDARLAQLLERASSATATPATPVELPGSDFQPLPFPAREEISTQQFSKRHIFWSYQQVVDAYGVPDEISTNPHGSQIWIYHDVDADLEFVFRDGFVLRVEW